MAVMGSKKWQKKRGEWFDDVIRKADDSDRNRLLHRVEDYREMYHREPGGFDTKLGEGPWEGSADLHIPVITEKVETAVPKVMSAMWRANPFVHVKRPGGSEFDTESTKNIENFLSWAFRNDIPGFYLTLEGFLRNMFIDGTAFAKIRWEQKKRRAIETHTVEKFAESEGEEPVGRSDEEILMEIFGLGDVTQTLYDFEQVDAGVYKVKFTEMGRPYTGRVEIFDTDYVDKLRVRVFRDIIEHESPVIDLVDLEDIVFPFRAKDLQSAQWVAHKTWYKYSEIEKLVQSKEWSLTRKELDILKGQRTYSEQDSDKEDQKDEWAGVDGHVGSQLPTHDGKIDPNNLLVWEIYTKDYVDGDDEPINVVHFLPANIRRIAGTEYADEVFPHGRRPFVSATYIPISGRVYGTGMAELLYGVNQSIDHTINTVHNNMTITSNPMFFYSPLAMAQNGSSLLHVKPGEGVPVMNPRDVFFPNFAQQPLSMYHASYQQMQGIADSLTFSPSIGGSNNYRNAPRTARGTMALMDAAEEKLSTIVEQLQATAWKEMVLQVASLYGHYQTIDKWYYVTGSDTARHVSPRELRDNFIFEFSGTLTSVNRDIQRTLAHQLYLTLKDEQAYEYDPHAKNELRRYFVESFGENIDVKSILPDMPGESGFPHPPWDQDEENRQMASGRFVQILPIDNHMEHLGALEAFMQSEAFAVLPDTVKGMVYSHYKGHEMALQQQMAQKQKVADTQGTGAANQLGQQAAISEPGAPTEGQPAMSGELSFNNGGQQ